MIKVITVGLLVHVRISNYASNDMTLSTGAVITDSCKITLGGGGVEVDIHEEVIEVITVGLLVHVRISNYASNNTILSTGSYLS